MIRFQPKKENRNTGTIDSFIGNLDSIVSQSMADQLNAKNIDKKCVDHPNFETIVLVSTEPTISFDIEVVCCEKFRNELETFLEK